MTYSVNGTERLKKDCAYYAANEAIKMLVQILLTPDEDFVDDDIDDFFGADDDEDDLDF